MIDIENAKKIVAEFNKFIGSNPTKVCDYHNSNNSKTVTMVTYMNGYKEDVKICTTVGLCEVDTGDINYELVATCLDNDTKELCEHILSTTMFELMDKSECKPEMVIREVMGTNNPEFDMKHMLLTEPFIFDKTTIFNACDIQINWLLALPISENEYKYSKLHSVSALKELLVKRKADLNDFYRKCVVNIVDTKEITEFDSFDEKTELAKLTPYATIKEFKEKWECAKTKDGIKVKGYKGENKVEILPKELEDGTKIFDISIATGMGFYPIKKLIIEAEIKNISKKTFAQNDSLVEVVLPDTLETISDDAFYHCNLLKEIKIPNSVTKISGTAFQYCHSLQSVELPKGLTTLYMGTFGFCDSLENIILPETLTQIQSGRRGGVFQNCTSLKSIIIPKGVTKIPENTFAKCTSLTKVILPEGVTLLGDNAFQNCTNLKEINSPSSLKKYGKCVFKGCNSLADANGYVIVNSTLYDYIGDEKCPIVPSEVTVIDENAFFNNHNITEVILPEGLLTIKEKAFYNCGNLSKMIIPKSVKKIEQNGFYDCKKLGELEILGKTKVM